MPKDRRKTYSDHQSQASRQKKEREVKKEPTKNAPSDAVQPKKP